MHLNLAQLYLKELETEAPAARKCLERVPEGTYAWKPHEKSMTMEYLVLLVAEMPKWITVGVLDGEIDFATFRHAQPKTTAAMVAHFDENLASARKALQSVSDDTLEETFSLKANGQLLMSMPKKELIGSTLNHWVHHRGQLTVYMRLQDLPVPQIYGPSADEQGFQG